MILIFRYGYYFCSFFLLLLYRAEISNCLSTKVLVVGSVNADITIDVEEYPKQGETIVAKDTPESGSLAAGGKGANQAVACRRLGVDTVFLCQFGKDGYSNFLESTLKENHVDISNCKITNRSSGLGLIFKDSSGGVSCVVLGGSNSKWPEQEILYHNIHDLILKQNNKIGCILLQMEVPQYVNEIISEIASKYSIPIFQDAGGNDIDLSTGHIQRCAFLSPNLTELKRLTKMEASTEEEIILCTNY